MRLMLFSLVACIVGCASGEVVPRSSHEESLSERTLPAWVKVSEIPSRLRTAPMRAGGQSDNVGRASCRIGLAIFGVPTRRFVPGYDALSRIAHGPSRFTSADGVGLCAELTHDKEAIAFANCEVVLRDGQVGSVLLNGAANPVRGGYVWLAEPSQISGSSCTIDFAAQGNLGRVPGATSSDGTWYISDTLSLAVSEWWGTSIDSPGDSRMVVLINLEEVSPVSN